MNRKTRRAGARHSIAGRVHLRSLEDARALRVYLGINNSVPEWCAAAKSLGRELKDCCVTITPTGGPYVWTRAETIDALNKLGWLDVVAAVRRATSSPDELLIIGVENGGYILLYGRDIAHRGESKEADPD